MNYGADLAPQTPKLESDKPQEFDCLFLSCNIWLHWISAVCTVWSTDCRWFPGKRTKPQSGLEWKKAAQEPLKWAWMRRWFYLCACVSGSAACLRSLCSPVWVLKVASCGGAEAAANELTGEKVSLKSTWMRLTDKWHTWITHRTCDTNLTCDT